MCATGGFMAKGAVMYDAQHQALAAMNGIVNRESAVMSFNDTFWRAVRETSAVIRPSSCGKFRSH